MTTVFQRPTAEFTRRAAVYNNKRRPSSSTIKNHALAATEAIASTAFQRNAFREASEEIQRLQRESSFRKKMNVERQFSSSSVSAALIDDLAQSTSFISSARQSEILELASRIKQGSNKVDEKANDIHLKNLVDALDVVGDRFSAAALQQKTPDAFCKLVADCCLKQGGSSQTVEKLFDRYRELMSPRQQFYFGFDMLKNQGGNVTSVKDFIQKMSIRQRCGYSYQIMNRLLAEEQKQSGSWASALALVSHIIPSKSELTSNVAVATVDVFTNRRTVCCNDHDGNGNDDSGSTVLDDLRRLIDELCGAKYSLVHNRAFWNAYLRGLSAINRSKKASSSTKRTTKEKDDIVQHALDLVQTNMPQYGVTPDLTTVELVAGDLLAAGDDSQSFIKSMIRQGFVSLEEVKSSRKLRTMI